MSSPFDISEAMLEIMPEDPNEPEDMFSIHTPGAIIFEVVTNHASQHPNGKTFLTVEFEVLDHWGNADWAAEGIGLEYWLRDYAYEPYMLEGTVWIVEDMEVLFTRGDGWEIDDDEEWYSGPPRMLLPWQTLGYTTYHTWLRRWLATALQPYTLILSRLGVKFP